LNYKVVDFVESYNFHIKFTSIRVQTKKLQIFENRLDPVHGGSRRYSTTCALLIWGTTVLPPSPAALDDFFGPYFFGKKKEKCKKNSGSRLVLSLAAFSCLRRHTYDFFIFFSSILRK
jgi:hypothetical protein